jgi:hypothetical protein
MLQIQKLLLNFSGIALIRETFSVTDVPRIACGNLSIAVQIHLVMSDLQ